MSIGKLDLSQFLFFLQHHLSGSLDEDVKVFREGVFYWRTKWEGDDDDQQTHHHHRQQAATRSSPVACRVLLLDATFVYRPCQGQNMISSVDDGDAEDEKSQSVIGLYLGVVVRKKDSFSSVQSSSKDDDAESKAVADHYYCRIPVQQNDLLKHFNAVGFDLDASNEWVLAQTMAQALLDGSSSARNISASIVDSEKQSSMDEFISENDSKGENQCPLFAIEIPLRYQDFDLVAPLRLTTASYNSGEESQVSRLVPAVLDFFRRNTQDWPSHLRTKEQQDNKANNNETILDAANEKDGAINEQRVLKELWQQATERQQQLLQQKRRNPKKANKSEEIASPKEKSKCLHEEEKAAKESKSIAEVHDDAKSTIPGDDHENSKDDVVEPATSTTTETTTTKASENSSRRRPPNDGPSKFSGGSSKRLKKPRIHYRVRGTKNTGSRYAGSLE